MTSSLKKFRLEQILEHSSAHANSADSNLPKCIHPESNCVHKGFSTCESDICFYGSGPSNFHITVDSAKNFDKK